MSRRQRKPQHQVIRKLSLADDLNCLLGDLCRTQGFCNRLDGYDLVGPGKELTAEEFSIAIVQAEGMNPENEMSWRHEFSKIFKKRYGLSVSAETYEPPLEAVD